MRKLLPVIAALLLANPAAATDYYDPTGERVLPSVTMCLNSSAQAVPCTDASALALRVAITSGGGAGGPATIADGADVAQGATTDAACAGDNTSGCTVEARLQRLAQRITSLIAALGSPFQAGGAVDIDQTTDVTTNGVVNKPSAASGAGVAYSSTAALASNKVLKASAGNLYSFEVSADSTLSGAAWWVMIFDATVLPSNGAVTPAKCYALASGTTSYSGAFNVPVAFATGVTVGVSTTGCFSLTASVHSFISGEVK